MGLPQAGSSTGYRLVNSEGDRLSGLVVDVFGEYAVIAVTAAWAEQNRAAVAAAVLKETGAKAVLWRANADYLRIEGLQGSWPPTIITPDGTQTQLKSPGWVGGPALADGAAEVDGALSHQPPQQPALAEASTAEPDTGDLAESLPDPYEVLEDGVRYQTSLAKGQKTGFYFDQRDNRARIRKWSAGGRVLDLCCADPHGPPRTPHGIACLGERFSALDCILFASFADQAGTFGIVGLFMLLSEPLAGYSGGFAINAALGGAVAVTAVDSSASALRLAAANGALHARDLPRCPADCAHTACAGRAIHLLRIHVGYLLSVDSQPPSRFSSSVFKPPQKTSYVSHSTTAAHLNGVADKCEFVESDVLAYLQGAVAKGQTVRTSASHTLHAAYHACLYAQRPPQAAPLVTSTSAALVSPVLCRTRSMSSF